MRSAFLLRAGKLAGFAAFVIFCLAFSASPNWAGERLLNGKGLLWKVEREGVEPSWVFGTMHVSDERVTALREPLVEVLTKVDSLSLELILHDRLIDEDNEFWKLDEGRRLRDIVGNRMFNRLSERLGVYGVGAKQLDRFKPWVVANWFGPYSPEGARRQSGMIFLDHLLQLIVAERGARVYALETAKEQIDVYDGLPMRHQVEMLRHALRYTKPNKNEFERMVKHYLDSDMEAIMRSRAGRNLEVPEFARVIDKRMLDLRNKNMVERMAPRLAEGNALIAVGAAHLPGRVGVLNLLAAQGYSLARVY